MHHPLVKERSWIKLQCKLKRSRKALGNLYYLGSVRCALHASRAIVYYAVLILCTILYIKIFVIMHHLVANNLPWIKLQSKWKKSRKALPDLYYLGTVRYASHASLTIVYYAVLILCTILCTIIFVIMHHLANDLPWIKLQSKWKKSRKALPNLYYLGAVRSARKSILCTILYTVIGALLQDTTIVFVTFLEIFFIMHRLYLVAAK